jgi:hypothetical protein
MHNIIHTFIRVQTAVQYQAKLDPEKQTILSEYIYYTRRALHTVNVPPK